MKVFISGSISIKRLPGNAIKKIDSIIDKNITIIIGDAKGIDSIVQKYLIKKGYKNVIVYFAGDLIRNNIGNWQTINVPNNNNLKGRELYTIKDIRMAKEADYGLMIWDNKSKGTLSNIKEMKKYNKQFFVIFNDLIVNEKHIDKILKTRDSYEVNNQLSLF